MFFRSITSVTRSQQFTKSNLLRTTGIKRIHTQTPSSSTAATLSAIVKEESNGSFNRSQVMDVIRSPYYNTGNTGMKSTNGRP